MKRLLISLSIIYFIIACYIISLNSVEFIYIGELNKSNLELVELACGDKPLIGLDGGCNHLSAICQRFWFPIHIWTMCFDGRIESVWWFE